MKKIIFLIITGCWIIFAGNSFADNVQFTASAKSPVANGEQFYLTYSVNAQGANFRAATIRDFNVISGPSQSSSSNIQWINGQMSQSVSISYTYILQAVKEGTFTIGPASIFINGKTYNSNPVTISVLKSTQNVIPNNQQRRPNTGRSSSQSNIPNPTVTKDDVFIRTIVSKSSAYKGEAILVTQKFYTKVNIAGFDDVEKPTYKDFWTEDIKMLDHVSLRRENYNGTVYNVAELQKTIIIPQKAGRIEIDPMELTCVAQIPTRRMGNSIWDDFFGQSYQNVKVKVKSNPITIDVKSLPPGQPVGFDGAVGNFTIKSDLG